MTPPPAPARCGFAGARGARPRAHCASDGPIKPGLARTMSRGCTAAGAKPRAGQTRSCWEMLACRKTLARGDGRAERSGCHPRGPLLRLMDGRGVSRVLDLAPVLQRRCDRGYSDLAVAAVET